MSRFVDKVAKKLLPYANGSIITPPLGLASPPVGLYVLIAVAVSDFMYMSILF